MRRIPLPLQLIAYFLFCALLGFAPLAHGQITLLLGAGPGAPGAGGGGGGGTFTPASLTTPPLLWYDMADGTKVVTAGGGTTISHIIDKGSVGALIAPPGAAPAYVAAGLNGLPVGRYDGTSEALSSGGSTFTLAPATLTILVVAKSNAGGYRATTGLDDVSGVYLGFAGSPNGAAWANNDVMALGHTSTPSAPYASAPTSIFNDGAAHVIRADLGAASHIAVDGTVLSLTGGANGGFPSTTLHIWVGQAGGNEFWSGDIAEVIYLGDESGANIQKVEGYLAWKWGLQGSLAAGHPYKSAAP